ncbi:RDD family protein [Actinotalea ferrariae]|nr:RDD family protein [Actinotalea ferrariae]
MPVAGPSANPLGAAFDGVSPARAGRRVAAYAIDLAVALVVAGAVWWFTRSLVYAGLAAVEVAAGLVVWEARSGRTVGNTVLGLRSAQEDLPYAPGLGRSVARALVLAGGHVVAGLGQWLVVASSAFDASGRRQGWHDKLAGTVVVDIRALRREEAPVAFQAPVVTGAAPGAEGAAPAAGVPDVHAGQPYPVVGGPAPQGAVPQTPPPPPPPPTAATGSVPTPRTPASGTPATPVPATPVPTTPVPTTPVPTVPEQRPAVGATAGSPPPPPPAVEAGVPAAPVPAPPVPATAVPATAVPAADVPATPVPATPVPTRPTPATSYVVTLDDGRAMSVSGPGYVGRRPQAPAGERVDHVIEIDDPGRSLSRTHAKFGIDQHGFWVADNGSANGTAVLGPDGTAVAGAPGERLPVPDGGTVRLGDRTFTVQPYA